ncbi:unnamed protein product [Macrosiphum euphorbiae]|uniref:Uncharacterized protein n=1 Tax=Macrosiphum euphorbiae TaxID=13131 RepID=A0AAV0XVA4_9HEMI|nr:unnamed protein product [Macrosiphum euphorbiae]
MMNYAENQSVNLQSTETEVMQSVFAELREASSNVPEWTLLQFSRYVTGPSSISCRYRSLENVTGPAAISHLQSTPANVTVLCRGPKYGEADDTATAEQPQAESSRKMGIDLVDRHLVLIPGNVVEAPKVPPSSDDRIRRDDTVPELQTVPAARFGQAELQQN